MKHPVLIATLSAAGFVAGYMLCEKLEKNDSSVIKESNSQKDDNHNSIKLSEVDGINKLELPEEVFDTLIDNGICTVGEILDLGEYLIKSSGIGFEDMLIIVSALLRQCADPDAVREAFPITILRMS